METELGTVQSWVQIGTSAGFAGLVWYLLAIALPKIQERFDTTLARQSEDSAKIRGELLADLKASRSEFAQQMELQRQTCQAELKELSETYERHIDRLMAGRG